MRKKLLSLCLLFINFIALQPVLVLGYVDDSAAYFPLYLPTQDQRIQEKAYENSYDGEYVLLNHMGEIERERSIPSREMVPLTLPHIFTLPVTLPETGVQL